MQHQTSPRLVHLLRTVPLFGWTKPKVGQGSAVWTASRVENSLHTSPTNALTLQLCFMLSRIISKRDVTLWTGTVFKTLQSELLTVCPASGFAFTLCCTSKIKNKIRQTLVELNVTFLLPFLQTNERKRNIYVHLGLIWVQSGERICPCGGVLLKYNVSRASIFSQVVPASLHHIQQQHEVCAVYL